MTLSPIHWVPVQDKGSKIQCVNFGAMKSIPSDPLHQEYLTINLGILVTDNSCSCRQRGSVRDGGTEAQQQEQTWILAQSLPHSVTHRVTHSLFFYREGKSSTLPINVSDTACNQSGWLIPRICCSRGGQGVQYSECKGQRAVGPNRVKKGEGTDNIQQTNIAAYKLIVKSIFLHHLY